MSKIKTHLEDLYELAEDALTTELAGTIKAHFKTDEEMYEWLDDEIFTDLRHVYQIVCDCRTDLPWNYVCLKSDKFIREVEKDYPELREDRRKDGFFLWDEADTAELYDLAADIVEFENDYDPYNGAFDSEEEAIASIMTILTKSPESITECYQERIEDEDDENGYVKVMKRLIHRIGSRDWKYDGETLTDVLKPLYILNSDTPESWGCEAYNGMIVSHDEMRRLAMEWGRPVSELMRDLERIQ